MTTTAIRSADRSDLGALLDLMKEFYSESNYPLDVDRAGSSFVELLENPDLGRVWLAERADQPAGYIVLTLGFSMEYGGRDAFVDDLFVRPAERRHGIGDALLETLIRECEDLGVRAVHLEVERSNEPAQALYTAKGFRDNDRQLLTLRFPPSNSRTYESENT